MHRRSVSGSSVFLAGAPIIYRCKFQYCVALSTTESELYAASNMGKYIKYIRSVLEHLGHLIPDSTQLFDDNAGTITISNNEKPTKRVRHVDICYFSIQEWIQNGDLLLHAISSSDNPADILTKSLGPQLFARHNATLLGKRRPWYLKNEYS